jgi:hypothetical protein
VDKNGQQRQAEAAVAVVVVHAETRLTLRALRDAPKSPATTKLQKQLT